MRRFVFIALASFALAAAAAVQAAAVDLPANQSSFASAQVMNGKLIWFQRNSRKKTGKKGEPNYTPGVGAIYSRELTAKKAQRVYLPPKGSKIVSFKAAAGRVLVGLAPSAKGGRGPSSIVELSPGAQATWPGSTLTAAEDKIDQQSCGSRVELIGIQTDADALIQQTSLESRGKECALVRQVSTLSSYPKAGGPVSLGTRTSGWSVEQKWNLLPILFPANGDWIPALIGSYDNQVAPTSTWNPTADIKKVFNSEDSEIVRSEPTPGGGILTRAWGSEASLYPNLAEPSSLTHLKRDGANSWFHVCGDSIIEITRKRSSGPPGKWNIFIRNSAGKTERKIAAKLNPGTLFDACDQNTAVFHHWRHDGGAHQWTVSLAP